MNIISRVTATSVTALNIVMILLGGIVVSAQLRVITTSPDAPGIPPARDANAPQTGTARIRGRVVASENGAPLRGAQVRLSGGGLREQRTAVTDERGQYEIDELPAGRFILNAAKGSYVSLSYGQRRPREVAKPIEVADKQVLEKIDFALPRGGVIVATVTDEFGEPIAGVSVQVQEARFFQGQRRIMPANFGGSMFLDSTDDLGQMRLFSLPPGEYYVSAAFRGGVSAAAEKGRVYATTYYPGTLSLTDAQRVTVAIGQEISVAFPMLAGKTARVTGVVRDSNGQLVPRPSVSLRQDYAGGMSSRSVSVQPDGSFTATNVLPGDYSIEVGPSLGMAEPGADAEYGSMPIHVSGDDINGLVVTTTKGGSVHGQVVFDTGVPRDVRPANVQLMAVASGSVGMPTGRFKSADDWTFEFTGLMGPRVVRLRIPLAGWFLKSVTLDGKDITETPIDFSDGKDVKDLQVILTQKQTTVSGSVMDDRDKPAAEFVTLIFPEDRELWTPQSRFIATGRPDQQGQFKITGLPPGRYLAAAVQFIEVGEERDTDLLERLSARATRLALEEGETKTLNLTLTSY